MKATLRKVIDIILPIIFITLITLAASFLYLKEGIAGGDDIKFHLGNIFDTYYGVKMGHSLDSTNHLLLGAYGYNTHLFYAPLPHYFAVILMLISSLDAIGAIKWSISLSCLLAAAFTYFLSKKITKSTILSLIASAFYIFFPYRMFCALCRFAYAETFAMAFIPVFFYGVYAFLHEKTPQCRSYLAIILGTIGLVLSHPFTALISVLVGLAYMAINFKGVANIFKSKKGIILTSISVVLIIAGVGFYVFPMAKALSSGLYRISDSSAVWTNISHVMGSTSNSAQFSGFLNFVWIENKISQGVWTSEENISNIALSLPLMLIGAILASFLNQILKLAPKNIYYRIPLVLISSFLPLVFYKQRIEVYLAMALYDIILLFFSLFNEVNLKKEPFKKNNYYDVIFFAIISIITLLFIFLPNSWRFVPSLFYTCQFAWRLYSILSFSLTMLFIYALKALSKIKMKIPLYVISLLPFLLFASSQCYIEKRAVYENPGVLGNIYTSFDETNCKKIGTVGAMNEYIPLIYYQADYQSEYSSSLYKKIRNTINRPAYYQFSLEDYLTPVFLEGSGLINVTELNSPSVSLECLVNEEALIQLPQFYYDGYVIEVFDTSLNKIDTLKPIEVDSLVSFSLSKGEYVIKVSYKGPVIRRVFKVIFCISLPFDLALGGFGIYELIKEKKEENNEVLKA